MLHFILSTKQFWIILLHLETKHFPNSMENLVGPEVTGKNFTGRSREIEKIIQDLHNGSHRGVYITGDRRIGITSILLELVRRLMADGAVVLLIRLDDAKEPIRLVELLAEAILKKYGETGKSALEKAFRAEWKETRAELPWRFAANDLTLSESIYGDWPDFFYETLRVLIELTGKQSSIYLFVDEFAVAANGGWGKRVPERLRLERFATTLEQARDQDRFGQIRWALSNSLSFGRLEDIYPLWETSIARGLANHEIGEMSLSDSRELMNQLSDSADLNPEAGCWDWLFARIGWRSPYHLQLIFSELPSALKTPGAEVTKEALSRAVAAAIKKLSGGIYPELERGFPEGELEMASWLLRELAQQDRGIKELELQGKFVQQFPALDFNEVVKLFDRILRTFVKFFTVELREQHFVFQSQLEREAFNRALS